jgi:hypothetical protein
MTSRRHLAAFLIVAHLFAATLAVAHVHASHAASHRCTTCQIIHHPAVVTSATGESALPETLHATITASVCSPSRGYRQPHPARGPPSL